MKNKNDPEFIKFWNRFDSDSLIWLPEYIRIWT